MKSRNTLTRQKCPGFLVITKDGKKGRTYHDKGHVGTQLPVYLEKEGYPGEYEEKAILCNPLTLDQKGFID